MNRIVCGLLFLFGAGAGTASDALSAVVLQPNEAAIKDTFVYQGIANSNFDTTVAGAFFGSLLGVGQTTTGHTTESLLQFDLSGVTLTAAQVTSATLELNSGNTTAVGFGANPSPSTPVVVDLYALGGTWTETTLTWNTPAPATAGLFASTSIDAINQVFTFDVTTLVKQWLDSTLTNNGLTLKGNAPVPSGTTFAVATFSSSSGTVAPKLTIVPEPSSVVLALSAAGGLAGLCRARAVRRRRLQ